MKNQQEELTTVYITKFWWTKGILVRQAHIRPTASGKGFIARVPGNEFVSGFYGSEFFLSEGDAILHVELKRKAKMVSVRKQLDRLENMVVADLVRYK